MATIRLAKEALIDKLESLVGASFISLKTMTTPKFNQKGRESGMTMIEKVGVSPTDVKKFSEYVAGLGYNYAQLVTNRLNKEGKGAEEYEPGVTWHIPYGTSKVIRQHKSTGELYFYVSLIANNKPKSEFVDISSGKVVPHSYLEEYLPKEYAPKNQGLEPGNEIRVQTLKLDSLKELKHGGNTYVVVA